ncbi:hypothetical protein B566_EDAN011333 [Ephemera danica]|nr:hypothetical protein B566_EDAN011333 [Ephemera danica]
MSGKGKQAVRKSGGKPSAKQGGSKVKQESVPTATVTSDSSESRELALSFPLLKISDNARILPRYTAILSRSKDEGVCMEDLDTLQLELEALLSAAALRIRALKGEVGALNSAEEKKDKKSKSSSNKPASPGKRGAGKAQDERLVKKSKDLAGRAVEAPQTPLQIKFTKVKSLPPTPAFQPSTSALPDKDVIDTAHIEPPMPAPPKNDAHNKFWTSVEPYCAEISTSDIQVIKDLIQAHESQTANLTIPPLGKHYSLTWLQEEVKEETLASNTSDKKKRAGSQLELPETANLMKKVDKRNDTAASAAAGGLSQRVVCSLIEENLMPSKDSIDDKDGKDGENVTPGHNRKLSNGLTMCNAANLEVQMRKELQEQGILGPEDEDPKEEDDEILVELKRCQEELRRLNQHNITALNRLLSLANDEVVDAYKKMMDAKYKKPLSKKEKDPAWKALKERDTILRTLEASSSYTQK